MSDFSDNFGSGPARGGSREAGTDSPLFGLGPNKASLIKVFGIGGCGCNTINHMINAGLVGPQYIAANSDLQELGECLAPKKIQLGVKCSQGLGCGGKPELGRLAAEEDLDKIKEALDNSELVFLAVGLGGGTGSGGAPLVAEALSSLNDPPLVVSVVTTPFRHERNRYALAEKAMKELSRFSNSVICVPNAKLIKIIPNGTLNDALEMANGVLYRAVSSITELILSSGIFNLDFADVRTVLSCQGQALIGYGEGSGEKRAQMALKALVNNPLLSETTVKGAKMMLVNITYGRDEITMEEFNFINDSLCREADDKAEIFTGVVKDTDLCHSDIIKVTVVATGLEEAQSLSLGSARRDKKEEEPIILEEEAEISLAPMPSEGPSQAEGSLSKGPGPRDGRTASGLPPGGQGHNEGQGNISQVRELKEPLRRVPLSGPVDSQPRRMVAGSGKYDTNSGVDPVNSNPDFYAIPSFVRERGN
jgi:cell division protein FtsZ